MNTDIDDSISVCKDPVEFSRQLGNSSFLIVLDNVSDNGPNHATAIETKFIEGINRLIDEILRRCDNVKVCSFFLLLLCSI